MCASEKFKYNLADSTHYAAFTDKLGGEARIRKSYPALYKALLHSRDEAIRKAAQPPHLLKKAEDKNGFTNFLGIDETSYQDGLLTSYADMGTVEATPILSIVGQLKDAHTAMVLNNCAVFDSDSHYLRASMSARPKEEKNYEYIVENTFTKITYDEKHNPIVDPVSEVRRKTPGGVSMKMVEELQVFDPYPKSPQRSRTIVYYNNRKGPGCDYYYNNVKQGKGTVQIMLPFNGSVRLCAPFTPLRIDLNNSFVLRLDTEVRGAVQFNSDYENVHFNHSDAQTIEWTFPEDWNNTIREGNFSSENVADFYCSMKLVYSLLGSQQPAGYIDLLIGSNDAIVEGDAVRKIPKIEFQWGCFAKETMIKMSDGSCKPIPEICAGEQVMTASGPATVTEVITGTEQRVTVITTYSGRTVRVSHDHPILTESGWKTADRITAADTVRTEAGLEQIEALYTEAYNDKVFSLRTDGDGTLIAGGIFAGDFGQQNKQEKPVKKPLDELQQEFDDLTKVLVREKECQHD